MNGKLQKAAIRSAAAAAMMAIAVGVFQLGHAAVALAIVGIQVESFRELVSLRYKEAKERSMPLFRTLQWVWFTVCMFYLYGNAYIVAPMFGFELLGGVRASLQKSTVFRDDVLSIHNTVSFVFYNVVMMVSVLSFRPQLYSYQLKQFAWTFLILGLVCFQLRCAYFLIYEGLFWLVFPGFLVIVNDTAAYFCGISMGNKIVKFPFLPNLSPKKTWEGFVGGMLFTLVFAWVTPTYFAGSSYLRCSFRELHAASLSGASLEMGSCALDSKIFMPIAGELDGPEMIRYISVGLGVFASIFAPFGGFFASAVKRGFAIKDFAPFIPGHGGLMDRVDCQFLMSMAAYTVFTAFVASPGHHIPLSRLLSAVDVLEDAELAQLCSGAK